MLKVSMVYNMPQERKKEKERKNFLEDNHMALEKDDRPVEQPSEHPDLYFDGVQVTASIFGVNMTFTLSNPHPKNETEAQRSKTLVTARTSLEHAKIFAMLLRKQIKTYEINTKIDIKVPAEVYGALGLDTNDW